MGARFFTRPVREKTLNFIAKRSGALKFRSLKSIVGAPSGAMLSSSMLDTSSVGAPSGAIFSDATLGLIAPEGAPTGPIRKYPEGHRLRIGRYSEPGRIYLITTVVKHRVPIFADLYAGRIVVQTLRDCSQSKWVETLAFVVMPDHVHWLISLGEVLALSDVMDRAKGRSARAVNQLLAARGKRTFSPLWQEGYYDHAVRREEDVKQLARYVIANPLRAGLVERIGDYSLWDAVWL